MKKTQPSFIENIGKCRDMVSKKDIKKLLQHAQHFENTWAGVKKHVDRHFANPSYELDFNYHDLAELAAEIKVCLDEWEDEYSFATFDKQLEENDPMTLEALKKICQRKCDYMYLDTKLRQCYKIVSYFAGLLKMHDREYQRMLDLQEKEPDFESEVVAAIRSFL